MTSKYRPEVEALMIPGAKYATVLRGDIHRVLTTETFNQLVKDKIRNCGPTPETIYAWNLNDYLIIQEQQGK